MRKKIMEYVGVYSHVELMYDSVNYAVYKWYNKAFIVSKIPSYKYKKGFSSLIWPFSSWSYKPFCTAIVEIESDIVDTLDFVDNFDYSDHIIINFINASNYIDTNDDYADYLNTKTDMYNMKYLKLRDEEGTEKKFYEVCFYKLPDDLVEVLEIN